MLEKINLRFTESIQTQISAAESLPQTLIKAAERLVACLLKGNKIIVCGHQRSYINAQLLVGQLLHRYELARPSFAAVLLQFDGVLASLVAQDDLNQLYKKQLLAVAKEGDVFIVFSPLGNEEGVLNALHSANNENLDILAFTSSENDHTKGLLNDNDIEISIPSHNEKRIIEGHLFCVNVLCELIDQLLFPQRDMSVSV